MPLRRGLLPLTLTLSRKDGERESQTLRTGSFSPSFGGGALYFGRLNRARSFSISARQAQPSMWSLTSPMACMKA